MPDGDLEADELATADADLPADLLARVEEMEDDPSLDFEDRTPADEDGWLQMYVECPDCQVPMAKSQVESETMASDLATSASETVFRAVCPACHRVGSRIRVQRVTAPFDELDEAYDDMTDEDA